MPRGWRWPPANWVAGRVIVMPLTTPEMKVRAVTARGAEVVLHGDTYDEAYLESPGGWRPAGSSASSTPLMIPR